MCFSSSRTPSSLELTLDDVTMKTQEFAKYLRIVSMKNLHVNRISLILNQNYLDS